MSRIAHLPGHGHGNNSESNGQWGCFDLSNCDVAFSNGPLHAPVVLQHVPHSNPKPTQFRHHQLPPCHRCHPVRAVDSKRSGNHLHHGCLPPKGLIDSGYYMKRLTRTASGPNDSAEVIPRINLEFFHPTR